MAGVVAIVGRPNVGKSTFFNRLLGYQQAIVDDLSGVTRDRQYGTSEWNGVPFTVIDTGGFVDHSEDVFEQAIREQVIIAIEEADVILFLVDVKTGVTDLDAQMAEILRKQKKPVVLIVNKVDNYNNLHEASEFYSLGFDRFFTMASASGSGSGEILDEVVKLLPPKKEEEEDTLPKFAIIGQPNVGKSSLLNALIGETRNIVTDIAGTTRDSIHTEYKKYGKHCLLVDTAGIRKKSKVHENLEFYSVLRAIKVIEEADVCLIVIDAELGIESQDLNLFRLAQKRNKGIVFIVNKWDLVEKDTHTAVIYEKALKQRIAPFSDVPIVFTSAIDKTRIYKALEVAFQVFENRTRKIATSKLNDVMLKAIEAYPPPSFKGQAVKIKFVTQLPTYFPAFAFFANHPKYIKEPYKNYLENQVRKHFNFTGVPIGIFIRKK